ncbi:unnamed protein product, partial [marine sediment metagenome]
YTLNNKNYAVEVTYIGGTTPEVQFKVNGQLTDVLAEGDTFTLDDGTIIGVRDIIEDESGEVTSDMVEFYLGTEKLKLRDIDYSSTDNLDNVEFNDEFVDSLYVNIIAYNPSGSINIDKIFLSWIPDDELFITEEQDAVFPGLESFRITYEGFTTPTEEKIRIIGSGDDEMELRVEVQDGDVSIPLAYSFNATTLRLGDHRYRLVLTRGTLIEEDQYFFLTTGSGVPSSGGEKSYVLQYRGADSSS